LAHEVYQRIGFFLVELVAERGHVAAYVASIHDGIENPFVGYVVLPLRVSKVARVAELSLRRFGAPVAAVTGDAVASIQLRCTARRLVACRRCERGNTCEDRNKDSDEH